MVSSEHVELPEEHHYKAVSCPIFGFSHVPQVIAAGKAFLSCCCPRVADWLGGVIDTDALMPEPGKAARVETGPTSQVQYARQLTMEHFLVDPTDMPIDYIKPTAGKIVPLREMLSQHASAEVRIIPGNVFAFGPGGRGNLSPPECLMKGLPRLREGSS